MQGKDALVQPRLVLAMIQSLQVIAYYGSLMRGRLRSGALGHY